MFIKNFIARIRTTRLPEFSVIVLHAFLRDQATLLYYIWVGNNQKLPPYCTGWYYIFLLNITISVFCYLGFDAQFQILSLALWMIHQNCVSGVIFVIFYIRLTLFCNFCSYWTRFANYFRFFFSIKKIFFSSSYAFFLVVQSNFSSTSCCEDGGL